jgi:hypothetical protein
MNGLLIECILKRPGGTLVDLYGTAYHFRAQNDPMGLGRDICVVSNMDHAQRLMSITEGYRLVGTADPAAAGAVGIGLTAAPPAPVAPAPVAPVVAAPAPAVLGPVDPAVTVLQPPADAPVEPPVTAPAPVVVAPEPLVAPPAALPTEAELQAMDIEALRVQAELELGRKPSPRAKEPLLIQQIMVSREEKAGQA